MLDTLCRGRLAAVTSYPAYKLRRRAREAAAYMAAVRAAGALGGRGDGAHTLNVRPALVQCQPLGLGTSSGGDQ